MRYSTPLQTSRLLAAVLILAICTVCCKKEEEPDPSADIVGTWELTSLSYDGYFEVIDEFIPVTAEGKNINHVLVTFNSNGTVAGNGNTFILAMASKADPTETLEFPVELFEDGDTWQRDGNTLHTRDFFGDGDSVALTIAELTAAGLHLTGNFEVIEGSGLMAALDIRFTRKN